MWNYAFFMAYLLHRDDTDYTASEVRDRGESGRRRRGAGGRARAKLAARPAARSSNRRVPDATAGWGGGGGGRLDQAYVRTLMDNEDNSWFPIARAMCLQKQSDEINDRLTRIEDLVQSYVAAACGVLERAQRGAAVGAPSDVR